MSEMFFWSPTDSVLPAVRPRTPDVAVAVAVGRGEFDGVAGPLLGKSKFKCVLTEVYSLILPIHTWARGVGVGKGGIPPS